jgi:O-antigen/teichoic acid export membrane protein
VGENAPSRPAGAPRRPRTLTALGTNLGGVVLSQIATLGGGIAAARMLGPSDRGHQALLLTVALIVVQFGSLGLPLAITFEVARGRLTAREFFNGMRDKISIQIAGVVLVHLAVTCAVILTTTTPAIPALVTVAVVPSSVLVEMFLGVLQGRQEFGLFNGIRLLQVSVYACGVIALAVLGTASLTLVMVVWVSSLLITLVIAAYAAVRREAPALGNAVPPSSFQEMRRFGLRGMLGAVSPISTMRADQLVVGFVLSSRSLGLYSSALAYANFPRIVSQAIGQVAYPRVAAVAHDPVARNSAMWRFTLLSVCLAAFIGAALAALARPLIEFTFGSDFAGAAGTLQILAAATVPLSGRRVLGDALRGAGFPGASSRVEIASWAFLVPSMLILGSMMGLPGVAWALAASYTITFVLLIYLATVLTKPGASASH